MNFYMLVIQILSMCFIPPMLWILMFATLVVIRNAIRDVRTIIRYATPLCRRLFGRVDE